MPTEGAQRRMELSIVIVNWNSKDYLHACVDSIVEGTDGLEYEIIVVDSGSFDGASAMLAEFHPKVRFIQSAENIGFARANNLGARHARGEVFLFLNPDTEVRGRAIVDLHAALADLERAGVVGARLLNSDGSLQTSCVQPIPTVLNQLLDVDALQRRFPKARPWLSAATFEGAARAVRVEAVSGACMMMRREVYALLQGFSEEYFMYAEDVDLCHRSRAAGLLNYYVPQVQIVHHGGGCTRHALNRFSVVMIPESTSRLFRKIHGRHYSMAYRISLVVAALVRLVLLVVLLPAQLGRGRLREWRVVVEKWVAILRWALGFETWVHRYDRRP